MSHCAAVVLALTVLLSAAPVQSGRYLMLLDGVPAGVVAWKLEGTKYTYTSTHAYRSTSRVREVVLQLGAQIPEVLALATLPKPGCVDAIEELTSRAETVCVEAVEDRGARGRIGAVKFDARYGADGRLERLEVPGAMFIASQAALPEGGDPFGDGFAVTGKGPVVGVSPAVKGAHQVSPRGVGLAARVSSGASCLELARERAAKDPAVEVAVGFVVEDGRAWPHAWLAVKKTGDALDPSVLPDDPLLTHRRYVVLPSDQAGALYLDLLTGKRQVTRSAR